MDNRQLYSNRSKQLESIVFDVRILKAEDLDFFYALVVNRILQLGIIREVQSLLLSDLPLANGDFIILYHCYI